MPCSTNKLIITQLQEQAKKMEDELKKWKELVKGIREQFYELNYFNTMQLLVLRRELGKLKRGSHIVSPDVLALLVSISSQISPQGIFNVVHHVTENVLMGPSEVGDAGEMEVTCHTPDELMPGAVVQLTTEPESLENENESGLTEEDLSEAQKEMLTNISNRLNCSKKLVLMAFEECPGDENDQYDFRLWCIENMDRDILDGDTDNEERDLDTDSEGESDSDESVTDKPTLSSKSHFLIESPFSELI